MTRPRNIPPETWRRLAALDHLANFHMDRVDANTRGHEGGIRLYNRMWVVKITGKVPPLVTVTSEGPHLSGALAAAVEMAERTWAR
jgi:hypothetical protein